MEYFRWWQNKSVSYVEGPEAVVSLYFCLYPLLISYLYMQDHSANLTQNTQDQLATVPEVCIE